MALSAVFLDKDGTLVENEPDNIYPARFRLMPGAFEAIGALGEAGFKLFVVTNQPGVARGRITEGALRETEETLRELFRKAGAELSGFYYCPHHPDGKIESFAAECLCRKPRPGLIDRAALEHGVDPSRSWMVGDILDDVEAGHRAGCRSILLDSGGETEWKISSLRRPDWVVYSLEQASRLILRERSGAREWTGLSEAIRL